MFWSRHSDLLRCFVIPAIECTVSNDRRTRPIDSHKRLFELGEEIFKDPSRQGSKHDPTLMAPAESRWPFERMVMLSQVAYCPLRTSWCQRLRSVRAWSLPYDSSKEQLPTVSRETDSFPVKWAGESGQRVEMQFSVSTRVCFAKSSWLVSKQPRREPKSWFLGQRAKGSISRLFRVSGSDGTCSLRVVC